MKKVDGMKIPDTIVRVPTILLVYAYASDSCISIRPIIVSSWDSTVFASQIEWSRVLLQ